MSFFSDWHEEPIGKNHSKYLRCKFDCGEKELNEYLCKYARQNHECGISKTILAIANAPHAIIGYYSLSPASIEYSQVPYEVRRGLGRYDVPSFRLGRLAVDRSMQNQRIGGQLFLSALRRCIRASDDIGGVVLLIDAKNERVSAWYKSYGALPLVSNPLSLILPLEEARNFLQSIGKA